MRRVFVATGFAAALLIAEPTAAFLGTPVRPHALKLSTSGTCARTTSTPLQLSAKLDAVFFDCDGVLADTERDGHRIAFNQGFKEKDLRDNDGKLMEWEVEQYGKLCEIGGGKERMMGYWEQIGWEGGDWELAKTLHLRKTEIFQELIGEGKIPLRPGVVNLVDELLAAKVTVAVCSTSNEKAVQKIVDMMGPERSSQIQIFAGDCVEKKKPAPDIYLLARDTYKLDSENCVVIEDSGIGLKSGKAAGMSVLVTKSTYTKNEDFSEADLVVNDLKSGRVDLTTVEGLASMASGGGEPDDWGVGLDISNANVGRGRW
jgi:HAD superfamily hydrolase (TIGR01509 family)